MHAQRAGRSRSGAHKRASNRAREPANLGCLHNNRASRSPYTRSSGGRGRGRPVTGINCRASSGSTGLPDTNLTNSRRTCGDAENAAMTVRVGCENGRARRLDGYGDGELDEAIAAAEAPSGLPSGPRGCRCPRLGSALWNTDLDANVSATTPARAAAGTQSGATLQRSPPWCGPNGMPSPSLPASHQL
jgi:hypothetical protein